MNEFNATNYAHRNINSEVFCALGFVSSDKILEYPRRAFHNEKIEFDKNLDECR